MNEDGIPFPENHRVSAAEGWLELGNPAEAERELEPLPPALASHPAILELRWRILAARGDWEGAVRVATRLVGIVPDLPVGWIHRSYALHELGRTVEARAHLLEAITLFPDHPILAYNLACYACRMGDLDDARDWLRRAAELKGRDEIREMARGDADLAALWSEIEGW